MLFLEIKKFKEWANLEFPKPHENIGGEWECNYTNWQVIYDAFVSWQESHGASECNKEELDELMYIIARDNEMEHLAETCNENTLLILIPLLFTNTYAPNDTKWQLATQLYKLSDKNMALNYLEKFVNDDNEYVVRRSLIEMGKLSHPKTEDYCIKLWHKDRYAEMEEYQRIAIVSTLDQIKSTKLSYYLQLASKDGRKYLVQHANALKEKLDAEK